MTESTEKVSLFQYFSGFLFPSTKGSKPMPPKAKQKASFQVREHEIYLGKKTEKEIADFISKWQRLIAFPESFPQDAKTAIGDLGLQKENLLLENNMIKGIISAHLEEADGQDNITAAIESSTKIFHEDFPGSYILTYNRKRLGMFRLSICKNDNGTYVMSYKFNPKITSFKELY